MTERVDAELNEAMESAVAMFRSSLVASSDRRGGSRLTGPRRRYSFPWDPGLLGRDVDWKRKIAKEQERLCGQVGARRTILESCPVCGSEASAPVTVLNTFEYVSCGGCGHVYLRTQPDADAVLELYAGQGPHERAVSFQIYGSDEVFAKRLTLIAEPKVCFIGEGLLKGATWVDVACGVGEVVAAARTAGWACRGVESDGAEVAFARARGLDVREGYVTPANVEEHVGDADMISLLNVLEHVTSPPTFLSGITSGLRPGARVAIEVPRHPSLSLLCNCSFPELAHRHLYAPDHMHVFTEDSIVETGRRAGLRPERIWVYGQDFSEIVFSLASRSEDVWPAVAGQVAGMLNSVQALVDLSGLSDKMLVVFEKE